MLRHLSGNTNFEIVLHRKIIIKNCRKILLFRFYWWWILWCNDKIFLCLNYKRGMGEGSKECEITRNFFKKIRACKVAESTNASHRFCSMPFYVENSFSNQRFHRKTRIILEKKIFIWVLQTSIFLQELCFAIVQNVLCSLCDFAVLHRLLFQSYSCRARILSAFLEVDSITFLAFLTPKTSV